MYAASTTAVRAVQHQRQPRLTAVARLVRRRPAHTPAPPPAPEVVTPDDVVAAA